MTESPAFGPEHTPFDAIGGAEGARRLTDAFYDRMDSDPVAKGVRDLHPDDLTSSREKFYMFLSGWLGGPGLYMQEFGHPRLRMRHAPFPIDEAARDAWLACMTAAMEDCGIDGPVRSFLDARFAHVADFLRNTK